MVINKKYEGNTLPEVMIALVIISFCTTLAVVIYLNIQQSTAPFIKLKSDEIASAYLRKTIDEKDFFDNIYKEEEFVVKKTVTRNSFYADCTEIKISVYNSNEKKLTDLHASIFNK